MQVDLLTVTFDTNTLGRSGPSVLDCDKRKWLNKDFGVEFVSL